MSEGGHRPNCRGSGNAKLKGCPLVINVKLHVLLIKNNTKHSGG